MVEKKNIVMDTHLYSYELVEKSVRIQKKIKIKLR